MLKVLELFAGIGAASKALENLGVEHEIVDAVEIDKYAIASFNAVHGTNFEPQDITTWDKDIECDLIMHGSPCQDFSVAGKQAGGDEGSGTRSSLMYETLRIVDKLKPKYVIWENVKNLLSKRHRHNFDAYLEAMEDMGYTNCYQVLNAKDYGVPQNRERVFTVSVRETILKATFLPSGKTIEHPEKFKFPARRPLTNRLKDVLETGVDEKYYLSDKAVAGYVAHSNRHEERGNGFKFEPTDGDTVAHTVSTRAGGRPTDNFIKVVGKLDIKGQDQIKRVYSDEGCSPTLSTMQGGNRQPKILEDFYKARPTRVYDKIAPTLRSERSGLKVQEPFVVASRGRGENNEQHLEPRKDGMTNTITSVAKNNYVAESTGGGYMAIKTANSKGFDLATDGDGVDLAYPDSKTRRGRVGHGVSKTLETSPNQGVLDKYRIRKLTPKECWRLMGFDDTDFEKAEKVNSNTQLYKQAGNSICVPVLEAIFRELLNGKTA